MRFLILFSMTAILCISCNQDDTPGELLLYGSGEFNFTTYVPFVNKPVKCFYHIPKGSKATAPVMVTIHGAGRDARALRNSLVASSNQMGFIVLSPQFSEDYFPGTNAFNLGNIFTNGEQPTPGGLNPEEEWTFSVLDPLYAHFKELAGAQAIKYDIFGHSAGAQMVHRFLMCSPESNVNRLVASASGWYMVPDPNINFPYGLALSPAATIYPALYFERRLYVAVGELDTLPNSFNLRHTPEADTQGLHRVARAQYFHQRSATIADSLSIEFQWLYSVAPQIGHDAGAMAVYAAGLLYN